MNVWMIGIEKKYATYEELKLRQAVAQGWPYLDNLSHMVGANNVREQIVAMGEADQVARIFDNLLAIMEPCDLVLGFEGLTLRGICQLTRVTNYHFDDQGQSSKIPPSFFGKSNYEYAHILSPVLWIDWENFIPYLQGGHTPNPPAKAPPGIVKSHQASDLIAAWQRFRCCDEDGGDK